MSRGNGRNHSSEKNESYTEQGRDGGGPEGLPSLSSRKPLGGIAEEDHQEDAADLHDQECRLMGDHAKGREGENKGPDQSWDQLGQKLHHKAVDLFRGHRLHGADLLPDDLAVDVDEHHGEVGQQDVGDDVLVGHVPVGDGHQDRQQKKCPLQDPGGVDTQ